MLENNHTIHLTLNGESRAFTVEPQETLLHVLRERAHLTGAKKGCDLGECGACTPGMIMAAKALLDRDPHPTREEIYAAMSSNLCRCTGYTKIEEAIVAASRVIEQYANGKEAQQ